MDTIGLCNCYFISLISALILFMQHTKEDFFLMQCLLRTLISVFRISIKNEGAELLTCVIQNQIIFRIIFSLFISAQAMLGMNIMCQLNANVDSDLTTECFLYLNILKISHYLP